jgi:hypothetical protein
MSLDQPAGHLVHFARARDVDEGESFPRCRHVGFPGFFGMLLVWMPRFAIKDHDHGLDLATDPGHSELAWIGVS